jgi:hypothetical protein
MMDESSFVKTPSAAQFQPIKEPIKEVAMTTEHTQTDLIRYFDRDLVATDHFAVAAKARHDRAAFMGEMIGEGVAWLWQRVTHWGETRSPAASCHVDHVQF